MLSQSALHEARGRQGTFSAGSLWEGPLLTRRQVTAGSGGYHRAPACARESAPNGDNLIHTRFNHTRKPSNLMKPCTATFQKTRTSPAHVWSVAPFSKPSPVTQAGEWRLWAATCWLEGALHPAHLLQLDHLGLHALQLLLVLLGLRQDLLAGGTCVVQLPHVVLHLRLGAERRGLAPPPQPLPRTTHSCPQPQKTPHQQGPVAGSQPAPMFSSHRYQRARGKTKRPCSTPLAVFDR